MEGEFQAPIFSTTENAQSSAITTLPRNSTPHANFPDSKLGRGFLPLHHRWPNSRAGRTPIRAGGKHPRTCKAPVGTPAWWCARAAASALPKKFSTCQTGCYSLASPKSTSPPRIAVLPVKPAALTACQPVADFPRRIGWGQAAARVRIRAWSRRYITPPPTPSHRPNVSWSPLNRKIPRSIQNP